jgi:hypothetical protein
VDFFSPRISVSFPNSGQAAEPLEKLHELLNSTPSISFMVFAHSELLHHVYTFLKVGEFAKSSKSSEPWNIVKIIYEKS